MGYETTRTRRSRTRASRPPDHRAEPVASGGAAGILALQRSVGNHGVVAAMRARTGHPVRARTVAVQREVTGKVRGQSFGDWVFNAISEASEEQDWTCKIDGVNAYVWSNAAITDSKDTDHFRYKEHLHLINQATEVAVVFTYVVAPVVDPGASVKKQKEQKGLSKIKQHSGGQSDEIKYNFSATKIPESIENVPGWMCPTARAIQGLPYTTRLFSEQGYSGWKGQYNPT